MNRLARNSLRRASSSSGGGGAGKFVVGAVVVGGAGYAFKDDIQEQFFGTGPNVERKQNIAAWREKQAKLKADREAKAAEAAQNTEEQPAEEPLEAVVQPAPDAVVEEVAEAVEVVEEPVEVAAEPVAEPETPIERPDREFDSFVEDNVEVEVPTEVPVEVVEQPAEATETAEVTEAVVEAEEPAVEIPLEDVEVLVGQASRLAAQTTDEAIEALDKASQAIVEYVKAKRYAFSFVGDTARRVAVWLQVNEYYNEMQRCVEVATQNEVASAEALFQLEELLARVGDQTFGLDQELTSMRQRICERREALSAANATLAKLNEIEENAELALEEHKQNLKSIVGDISPDEDELWRTLNPKFSQNDLKGLIFISQKKIQNYKEELQALSDNFDQMKAEALRDQEERLNEQTQERINQLEAEYQERINQKREEIKESLREEYEEDLALQLKRQAQAHSMHLADELVAKEADITAHYTARINAEITALTEQYQNQIDRERSEINEQLRMHESLTLQASAHLKGHLDGIHQTLEERLKTESQITSLQTLLVGIENLNSAVTCDNPVPLSEIVSDLKRVTGESAFLHPVLDSLPAAAIESGVVSSKALRNSFTGVKQLAYDNHLCNESQHGFVMSSLSRLYSFFGVGEELSKLSGLVATAEGHMQNEDFESAVRVLNQTNGEPHRIFSKWMDEARLYLEVKQAMDALKALSEARILSSRSLS